MFSSDGGGGASGGAEPLTGGGREMPHAPLDAATDNNDFLQVCKYSVNKNHRVWEFHFKASVTATIFISDTTEFVTFL